MTFASGTGLAIGISSAIFLALVIWRAHPNVPAAAFWSFAILATTLLIALLAGPALLENSETWPKSTQGARKEERGLCLGSKRRPFAPKPRSPLRNTVLASSKMRWKKIIPHNSPTPTKAGLATRQLGFDCPGRDIGATEGPQPDDQKCTGPNQTAICWDNIDFVNRSQFSGGPWCTYKSVSPQQCTSGSTPDVCSAAIRRLELLVPVPP